MECFSLSDTGTETLNVVQSDPSSWSLVSETDQFTIQDSITNAYDLSESCSYDTVAFNSGTETSWASYTNGYSIRDVGDDSLSGTASDTSDSYTLSDSIRYTDAYQEAGSAIYGPYGDNGNAASSDSLAAAGSDSFAPGQPDNSTMSFAYTAVNTSSGEGSLTFRNYPEGSLTVSSIPRGQPSFNLIQKPGIG